MDILSGNEMRSLTKKQEGMCVSIYMPTIKRGIDAQHNQIRYKNLLKKTEENLLAANMRPSEVKDFLLPAMELSGDVPFWQKQKNGLVVFIASGLFNCYRLPQNFEELVVVSDRFHLKPLIPVLSNNIEFYIIAISKKQVRLLECSRYSKKEVSLEGIPEGITDVLKFDVFEKNLYSHTGSTGGGGRTTMFHGHGADTEDTKTNMLIYFQKVDRGLREYLRDKRVPLIFAGVDYLFPLYKEANSYPFLVDKAVSGNPETLGAEELHTLAWPIVQSILEERVDNAIAQYRQNAGTGLTSNAIEEIVPSAYHGRVGVLFTALGVQKWGAFNPESDKVVLNDEAQPGCEDLLDFAAIQTFLNGGTVHALKMEELPNGTPLSAIFRY